MYERKGGRYLVWSQPTSGFLTTLKIWAERKDYGWVNNCTHVPLGFIPVWDGRNVLVSWPMANNYLKI